MSSTFQFSQDDMNKLNRIQTLLGASSRSEVLGKAIDLIVAATETANGNPILMQDELGRKQLKVNLRNEDFEFGQK